MPQRERYCIISVDGGGCRGVIPSMLLQSLGQSTVIRADMFAGTSTGSILAGGLASGVTIDQITEVYQRPSACRTIFTPFAGSEGQEQAVIPSGMLERLMGLLESEEQKLLHGGVFSVLESLLYPLCTSVGLRSVISEFPQTQMPVGSLAHHCFLASFLIDGQDADGSQWLACAFHNLGERAGLGGFGESSVLDAIMASAAAPMVFPPHAIGTRLFVDGGLIANNPGLLALAAAMRAGIVGAGGVPLERVSILSLGTGRTQSSYPPAASGFPPPYGMLGWMWPEARGATTPAMPVMNAPFGGIAQINDYQLRSLLGPENYRRAELDFGTANFPLNACDKVHGPDGLIERTQRYMETAEWKAIASWAHKRLD